MLSHLLVNDNNILPPLFLKEQRLALKLYVRKISEQRLRIQL